MLDAVVRQAKGHGLGVSSDQAMVRAGKAVEVNMKPASEGYSFQRRAAEKAASRAKDEAALRSGEVAPAELARINGAVQGVKRIGPSARIRRLAEAAQVRRK